MYIQKVINKIFDVKYLKFAIKHYPRRLSIINKLNKLKNYHIGRKYNFKHQRECFLKNITEYAFSHCPYYNSIFKASGLTAGNIIKSFDSLPFLTKDIIRQNYADIVPNDIEDLICGRTNTGGSTGVPLEFHTSANYDPEHQLFLYKIIGYEHGDKILAMDGTRIGQELVNDGVFWAKKSDSDIPYGSFALSSLYLNEQTASRYCDFINSFDPVIIRGYPAFINDIANYIQKSRIKIKCCLKGVVLTSESVNADQIKNIANAFNTKVFLQYGHSEAALFAYTIDDTYEYYCSPFYGFVEVVDEDGIHVKPGELGEVVVTGFFNYAMPFIRYKTGDLAVFSGDIDGIVKLKSVLGRTQDFVYKNKKDKVLLTALIFGGHYKAFANIKKWQIIQDKPGEVTVKIIKDKLYNQSDEDEIKHNFYKTAGITATIEYVEQIPLTNRGKFMFFIQNIK